MIIKTEKFSHGGRNYEIRVTKEQSSFEVRAYRDGQPANGYNYKVDDITNMDHTTKCGVTAYDHLIEVAKSDIENCVWESYLAAVRGHS